MAEAWGQILRAIGSFLNAIYELIPSYGLAIIILTILVRLVLFPLGVKQIRSMSAMQKIQPKLKELQKKHKGDRQRLNEEMMKLYREHNVNPLGGCFPLLLQMPVFIALYAVIRAVIPYGADTNPGVTASAAMRAKTTICRPTHEPVASGPGSKTVRCETEKATETTSFELTRISPAPKEPETDVLPAYLTRCNPPAPLKAEDGDRLHFTCFSPFGTGHLPKTGALFEDVVKDKATFVGMHLACSPTQTVSKTQIRQCTAAEGAGGGLAVVMSFLLVALMAGTTYYQQKQMTKRAPAGPQAQQMQMMGRIMPLFMGFLSLSFPTALSLYWVVGNFWMIGQQHVILNKLMPQEQGSASEQPAKPSKPANKPGETKKKPKR